MAKIEILFHAFGNFYGFHKGYPLMVSKPFALSGEDFDLLEEKSFGTNWVIIASCNTVLIESDKKIIVDPGISELASCGAMTSRLAEMKLRPDDIDMIVNTHLHGDHMRGNYIFRGKTLVLHEKELDSAKKWPHPEFLDAYVRILKPRIITEETKIAEDVRVIETPGHTPGSISVLVDTHQGQVAVVGDLIPRTKEDYLNRKPPFWEPEKEILLKSWEKIDKLSLTLIIPGHDVPFPP